MAKALEETIVARDCILVLGMHRSGTSALAGVLARLGCATPASLIRGNRDNEKGYFESNAVGRFSDAILTELGSAWNDWVPLKPEELPRDRYSEFLARARQIILDDFADASLFVLKEPRMCRMVPLWLEALQEGGYRVHVVHTHRNPQEVAASLSRRDGFEPTFSLLMWMRHVLDAESATRGLPRVFTSYRHLLQDWQLVMDTITGTMGLTFPSEASDAARAVDAFLCDRLQHFSSKATDTLINPALPQNVRDTFAIMERWAETGEQKEDHVTLDVLRAGLDTLTVAFAPLVRPGQMAMLGLVESQAEIASAKAQIHGLKAELDTHLAALHSNELLRAELAEKEAEVLKLRENIQDRDCSLEALAQSLDRIRARQQ